MDEIVQRKRKAENLLDELASVLRHDDRLVADGKLLKNKVVELGLQPDSSLLKRLLSHPDLKSHFFQEVEGMLVFDKVKFQQFVSSKSFLPDSYTSFKNKIGLSSDGNYLKEAREVVLSWPYKDCLLEGSQTKEDRRRNEVFWNATLAPNQVDRLLAPKVLTNFKKYTSKGEEPVTSIAATDNFILRGNNLLALHSLRPVYAGKVKLIYIDPPYNTGNDSFRYNDSFNHSTWLTFMKNRLEVAKELLRPDGFILLQIDNNEESYLKVLCDEVFGRENYRNSIIVKKGTKNLQLQFETIQKLNAGFDTILLYSKREEVKLPNLFKELKGATTSAWNNHWRGTDRPTMRFELLGVEPEMGQWRWERNRSEAAVANYALLCGYIRQHEGTDTEITDSLIDTYYQRYLQEQGILEAGEFELIRLSKTGKPEHYIPPRMQVLLSENWMDLSVAGRLTKFEHEKNEEILRRAIEWLTKEGDLVLDFFLGSGSTAAVAHKLKRQYIGIEQMNYGKEDATNRLQQVIKGDDKGISPEVGWKGGGSFVYAELAKLNQHWVERIAEAEENELDELLKELELNPFLHYSVQPEMLKNHATEFAQLEPEIKRQVLYALLDNNQLYINLTETADADLNVTEEDKRLNKMFYHVT
ncbi:DNA methyltransferase [Pontibacter ruber]|uniref:site-specific DNA-methyltransferase (adenine-specific) n=1 Tax=Pontibacter ruber TaxID=1343895 RepID=A0ABW5CXV8_9BACT|nr:site-specific DNA-methyltransferase [Pontibacter ruber]